MPWQPLHVHARARRDVAGREKISLTRPTMIIRPTMLENR